MKRKIVIAILCAAVSMGTIGCGNSTASAKTTQTQTDKKEDSKSENSEKSELIEGAKFLSSTVFLKSSNNWKRVLNLY